MTIQRQTNPSGGQHGYTRESALAWVAAHLQEELAAMPDHALCRARCTGTAKSGGEAGVLFIFTFQEPIRGE